MPSRIDVTPHGGGDHDERAVLNRTLEPDRLYVMNRGYAKFQLFNHISSLGSKPHSFMLLTFSTRPAICPAP